ncbi:hypothetical protein F441_10955, partial [Phytophthora nicotianae CJ01A1]
TVSANDSIGRSTLIRIRYAKPFMKCLIVPLGVDKTMYSL